MFIMSLVLCVLFISLGRRSLKFDGVVFPEILYVPLNCEPRDAKTLWFWLYEKQILVIFLFTFIALNPS